ncbi:MAG: hypothetical protein MJK08_11290 [Campylobacterales bacterium]|nr:hypothetical protein [Campylobacterales bacterium]
MSLNNIKKIKQEKEKEHENNENPDQAGCCPKVVDFSVSQKDRDYKLDIVVKSKDQEPNDTIYKDYRLFIVTPPAKDGEATTKKINIKQEFSKQKPQCKFCIEARDEEGNSIRLLSGDDLEIDTNGNIKTNTLPTTKAPKKQEEIVKKVEGDIVTLNSGRRISCTSGYDETQTKDKNSFNYRNYNINVFENKKEKLSDQDIDDVIEFINNNKSPLILKQKNEHSISYFFKLFTGQHDVFKKITLKPVGSSKCTAVTKHATLYLLEDMSLKGEVGISFAPKHTTAKKDFKGRSRNEFIKVKDSYVSIYGNLEFRSGTHIIAYEAEVSKGGNTTNIKRKKVQDLFRGPSKCVNEFYALFEKATEGNKTVTIDPGRTSLNLKASNLKFEEKKNDYSLDWSGSISLGVALFHGSEFTIDIINAVVAKGNNKMATFIDMVRKKGEEGIKTKYFEASAGANVDFKMSGSLSGECIWTKEIEKPISVSGKVAGEIKISLLGSIHIEGRVFEIKHRSGIKVEAQSGISAEMTAKAGGKGELDYDGDIFFNGLVIYYGMYSETKSNETLKTVKVIKPKSFKNKKNTKVTSKADEELVLMDKFSIPDKIFGKDKNNKRKKT